jgi:hypothetical protein
MGINGRPGIVGASFYLRELGDFRRDPPRFVACQQFGR